MSIKDALIVQAKKAKEAARILAVVPTAVKNQALEAIAGELENSAAQIIRENNRILRLGRLV